MKLTLNSAALIQRYKRFLADIVFDDNSQTTIHCANTGAMTGCADKDDIVWYSISNNTKRKYPYSWELTEKPNKDYICVNTARANQLAIEAIENNVIDQLTGYEQLTPEVKYGNEKSRIDILLQSPNKKACYVEVKSVTLLEQNSGFFPDAKTVRGQKHLRELMSMIDAGHRAVLLFTVLHTGINSVSAAAHIDPIYAALLKQAIQHGVEVYAYKAIITPQEIMLKHEINTLI